MRNLIVIGASSGGQLIVNTLSKERSKYNIVGILDADENKHCQQIEGIQVLGGYENLESILVANNIDEVIVAIANIEKEILYNFVEITSRCDVDIRIIPNSVEKTLHDDLLSQVRMVNPADLLGRSPVSIDTKFVFELLKGKSILVTGAAGSIGSELIKQLLKFEPYKLIALDVNENDLYYLELYVKRHYPNVESYFFIANIREIDGLEKAFSERPNVVFHAAAHKHVPMMEKTPNEAIKNNVIGTLNVLNVSKKFGVEIFVLISTDKAVNPTNVMGATKRLAEKVTASFSKTAEGKYVSVRFGNVLGSNGSVVPIFKNLIEEGQNLTLTHEDATRYFMTIPEAAQLVIEAGCRGENSDLFVLDMGEPIKILTLAKQLITLTNMEVGKEIKIEITGLRPGEKLHEELFYDPDKVTRIENPKIFRTENEESPDLDIVELESKLIMQDYKDDPIGFLKSYVDSYVTN